MKRGFVPLPATLPALVSRGGRRSCWPCSAVREVVLLVGGVTDPAGPIARRGASELVAAPRAGHSPLPLIRSRGQPPRREAHSSEDSCGATEGALSLRGRPGCGSALVDTLSRAPPYPHPPPSALDSVIQELPFRHYRRSARRLWPNREREVVPVSTRAQLARSELVRLVGVSRAAWSPSARSNREVEVLVVNVAPGASRARLLLLLLYVLLLYGEISQHPAPPGLPLPGMTSSSGLTAVMIPNVSTGVRQLSYGMDAQRVRTPVAWTTAWSSKAGVADPEVKKKRHCRKMAIQEAIALCLRAH
eukprot:scaffold1536_cov397-Prasinococcus_capsulatus_cf.AAC.13